jgi:hypothetical protein
VLLVVVVPLELVELLVLLVLGVLVELAVVATEVGVEEETEVTIWMPYLERIGTRSENLNHFK